LWINQELTAELKKLIGSNKSKGAFVFDQLPSMKELRADLETASIQFKDEQGRIADFHALRHTLATNLAEAGVHPMIAKDIMRHSNMKVTENYTHLAQSPLFEAVAKLPTFNEVKWNALGNAPNLVKEGLGVSANVHSKFPADIIKPLAGVNDCLPSSLSVPNGQTEKLVAGLGFEPRTFRL
jgi:hypothetical protein